MRKFIFILFFIFFIVSCLGTETKKFGNTSDIFLGGNASTDRFLFNFAYKAVASRTVYLQGAVDSGPTFTNICNFAGTGCVCEFMVGSGDPSPTTNLSSGISYQTNGNYFRCTIPASVITPDSINFVRFRNISNSKKTDIYLISTSTTLAQLLGDLVKTKVRTVSRYRCMHYYLEKTGTTSTSFDCSDQGAGDLSIDTAPYYHYLYADNFNNNFREKGVDLFYGGSGANICNMSLKQVDCMVDAVSSSGSNVPVVDFGLYAESAGQFTVAVSLLPKPSLMGGINELYGYAAPTSTGDTTGECPPGLSMYIPFTDTPAVRANSNMTTLQDTRVMATTGSDNMTVSTYTGGDCDATNKNCTAADTTVAPASTTVTAYSSAGQTPFCVIPGGLLPP